MKEQETGYLTITGSGNIQDKIIEMILEAEKRIYLSASGTMIMRMEQELLTALKKEIKLVLITDLMPENLVLKEKAFVT